MIAPRRILVATSFSPSSARALEHARHLAARSADPSAVAIDVLHVVPTGDLDLLGPGRPAPESVARRARRHAEARLEASLAGLDGVRGRVQLAETATAGILAAAEALDVDLVVVGAHGRVGVDRMHIGSTAEAVARYAPASVLVVRGGHVRPDGLRPGGLLAPVDFSEPSAGQVRYAHDLARAYRAPLRLVHVLEARPAAAFYPPPPDAAALEAPAREALAAMAGDAAGVEIETLRGAPAVALLDRTLDPGIEMVVVAARGRGGGEAAHLYLGGVAEKVVRAASAHVLVVRAEARPWLTPDDV